MISELLKKIDIKTTPLLIAFLIVLVVARFGYGQGSMLLELLIILLSVYLFVIFVIWGYNTIQKRKLDERCKQYENRKKTIKNEETNELIWNFFLGLSNQRLQLLIELIKLPEAGSKYKRVVPPMTILKNQLEYDDGFKIRTGFNWYIPMLMITDNYEADASMVVDINPTLYHLIEHYNKTGKKERV